MEDTELLPNLTDEEIQNLQETFEKLGLKMEVIDVNPGEYSYVISIWTEPEALQKFKAQQDSITVVESVKKQILAL